MTEQGLGHEGDVTAAAMQPTCADASESPIAGVDGGAGASAATGAALDADARFAKPVRVVSGGRSLLLDALANRATLLLGVALALAVVDPARLSSGGPVGWLFAVAVLVAAIWAAPAVAHRPAATSLRPGQRLIRHRNSVFAVGCTVLAGLDDPPVWLTAVDAGLLLAYLLAVDALAAGPVGVRQLRRGTAPLAAAAAVTLVLLGAHAPVDSGAVWGRIVAALAVAVAALAAGTAMWLRHTGDHASPAGHDEESGVLGNG